ncbi:MAG: Hsp70 family protein, partial [Acidimicrobiia bacterium]|nr:Hsp70 family protein [Acidimicrobiia bacterium]
MDYFLGVDLGTTFSAAATARDGRAEVVTLGSRSPSIPSVVVLRAHGEVLVGEPAERRAFSEPARTAREFKRRLGDPTPMILGGTPYGAEALMALLLRHVVGVVVEREGEPPEAIVLSHPANYGPYKKDLLVEMVRQADVGPVRFVTEPEAAAIHYADRDRLEPGEVVAVYDFGGGTFDAAVLRTTADGFELVGTPEGMDRLGGIDFDHAVFAHVRGALGGLVEQLDPSDGTAMSALARLRDDCRVAKEALSSDTDATIPIMLPNAQTEVRITREEFEAMIRPRLAETIDALRRAIRSAGITTDDVARVLLVGGSSRIPLVGQMVREAIGRPVSMDADPKYAIALGAAVAGERQEATAVPE